MGGFFGPSGYGTGGDRLEGEWYGVLSLVPVKISLVQ